MYPGTPGASSWVCLVLLVDGVSARILVSGESPDTATLEDTMNDPTDDLARIHALSLRVRELEAQYRELEYTHTYLAQEVMKAVTALAEENEICYSALTDILELQVGTVQIAEHAILRILDLRQSFNP